MAYWPLTNPEETVCEQKTGNRALPFRGLEREIPSNLFIVSDLIAPTIPMSRELPEVKMIPEINVDPPTLKLFLNMFLLRENFIPNYN